MNKLISITKKNFLSLIKTRLGILIIILGPLLIIFLAGIAFDNLNEYKINIGIYSPTYTQLTNSFISKLNTDQFRTIKAGSEAECIDDVKIGLSNSCVIFPANFALGAENKVVTIFIDYSKLNLAWIVRDRLFARVQEKSTEISKQLTENILSKLLITKDEISSDINLAILVEDNEKIITNKSSDALHLFANNSVGFNLSSIDRLESKTTSVKTASDIAFEEYKKNLILAEDAVKKGDFEDDEKEDYLSNIKKQRSSILEQKRYIEGFYGSKYLGSINRTIEDIRSNANVTNTFISNSKNELFDINELAASNSKLLKKMIFSMDAVNKDLENIDVLSAEEITAPIVADIKPLTAYSTYLNFIFPTLMSAAIMLAALLLSTIIVVMELNSQAFFRNTISPTSNVLFFFSSYLTNLSIIGVQIFVMLIISMLFFFSQVTSNILTTLFVSFLIATFFIVLGMGIGFLFKTEQMSILAATFSASIFLFLSNILVPIENMSQLFTKIAQFNPFIISVSLLRKSILFQQSIIDLNQEIFYLVIFTIALLSLYAVNHYIEKYIKATA